MQILGRDIVISLFIVTLLLTNTKEKRMHTLYNLGIILLTFFMVVIFSLTGISPMSGFHLDIRIDEIAIIPLKGIITMLQGGINTHAIINIFGNILMFAPIGFLIPLLNTKLNSFKKVILFGFCISLFIECTQLFLTRGTDIDDLILNTTGTAIGYGVFIVFRKIFRDLTEKVTLSSLEIKNKYILNLAIIIPYVVIIVCGFYDRFAMIKKKL